MNTESVSKKKKGNAVLPLVNRSIYPIITKSEMWMGCGNVEYLVETTTEIGENYGGQSSRVIKSRNAFQYCS